MEFESIKKIVEAEKEAENKKQEAKKQAKMILEKVETTRNTNLDYFKKELERKEKELQIEKSEENSKVKIKIQNQTNETIKELHEKAQENMPNAVNQIFNKVINI